jgi:serine/tyrosine/threonine adenylyltransferase
MQNSKKNGANWNLESSYLALPDTCYSKQLPEQAPEPELVCLNEELAAGLGLHLKDVPKSERLNWLSGNEPPPGAVPFAQAYAGHQFGNFTMLGDGRAIMIGEQITPSGMRYDLQWKGAGKTIFSRGGDGRATLQAMLREYLISEAMHALGIPSSRSLSVVKTGNPVYREDEYKGAVLVRVAESHIRVGTFEYMRHFTPPETQKQFLDYVIHRHFPELQLSESPAADLLREVMNRQISLICHWMRCGFIHGVMNTDNMSIAGETIDYGPCAFMNAYHPGTVFSSIDRQARYAFGKQQGIAQWNLGVLAGALLPLWGKTEEDATEEAKEILLSFELKFQTAWSRMMAAKLGNPNPPDSAWKELIAELLKRMQTLRMDYTLTFAGLSNYSSAEVPPDLESWIPQWHNLLKKEGIGLDEAQHFMRSQNPFRIPRNHWVEEALDEVVEGNTLTAFNRLLEYIKNPYDSGGDSPGNPLPPAGWEQEYYTFCGT